ncbi:MAG TPA: SRPBCC family protein [Candidatus Norongarragalinales archaeon]|nr:SRPBCC family protein [Candidatus Norongarragalinales archaeon]
MKTIKQKALFDAAPHDVFEALMDSKKHREFTGAKATLSRKVGGAFSVWNGFAKGKNLQLVKDKKIVQSWRANDWPKGAVSRVVFDISSSKHGTELLFSQNGVPEEFAKDIEQGWIDFYWKPMARMFAKAKN